MKFEVWESKFKQEGTLWKFEPANSALVALDMFKANQFKKILIPGIGYGRNAKLFYDNDFDVTGIEISRTAIDLAAQNKLDIKIHYGSVTTMPFDEEIYDGIFCYALLHLLNKRERSLFLKACFNQLRSGGIMIFSVVSTKSDMYGTGKSLSKDRFEITKGISVFFYDSTSIIKEFSDYGLMEQKDMDEPIKFKEGYEPIKCKFVVCQKK